MATTNINLPIGVYTKIASEGQGPITVTCDQAFYYIRSKKYSHNSSDLGILVEANARLVIQDNLQFTENIWAKPKLAYGATTATISVKNDGYFQTDTQYVVPQKKRAVFIGDSLTYGGQSLRAPNIFDGRTYYGTSTPNLTNLGGGSWIVYVMVDSRAPSGTAGTLETDGNGNLRWTATGDSAGDYVFVGNGGWYYLNSGTANQGILVAVRGATADPAAGTGTVAVSGIPQTQSYLLIGYLAWVAGAMGDAFSDYQAYGITGAKTADILLYAPQAFQTPVEACFLLMGVNDLPTTAAAAQATLANIKATIDICRMNSSKVYVLDIFPNPSGGVTVEKFLTLVSEGVRDYCYTLRSNVRFISSYQRMVDTQSSQSSSVTGRTGVYHTDNLHLMPYGAYQVAKEVIAAVSKDYMTVPRRKAILNVWDATLLKGSLNTNPSLRGTAGTVVASKGVTGTAPDGWTLTRTGSNQLCTTSFVADSVNLGLDWFCMDISAGNNGEYHELNQSVTIPSGVNVGDYIRLVAEFKIFDHTGNGNNTLQIQANDANSLQSIYLLFSSRNVTTFSGGDNPELYLASEPQYLLPGVTSMTIRIRVGGTTSATGKIGFRLCRLEKVDGPVYP